MVAASPVVVPHSTHLWAGGCYQTTPGREIPHVSHRTAARRDLGGKWHEPTIRHPTSLGYTEAIAITISAGLRAGAAKLITIESSSKAGTVMSIGFALGVLLAEPYQLAPDK